MKTIRKQYRIILLLVVLAFMFAIFVNAPVASDDDEDGDRNEISGFKKYLDPVENPVYFEECGDCHIVYQPGLLPSTSWEKIMSGLEDHFGEDFTLEIQDYGEILRYLTANAAEYSTAKRSRKIVSSLRGEIPLRITEIPYILKKHREIPQRVLRRESIGSLSNCDACHQTANEGIYSDDYVTIPEVIQESP